MKYIDEFRQPAVAQRLAEAIRKEANPHREYRLMEFCGGHTHAIFRYGVEDLMPDNVRFIHGPGCPVCVLPIARLAQAIDWVQRYDLILCTYGDLMRVPAGKGRSLLKAKAAGGDIRMVYSTQEALKIARANPTRQVVFFAIGFETTTPATAVAVEQAQRENLDNFSVYCNHVLTPSAMRAILDSPEPLGIDGFLGPSHVSTIIGTHPYLPFAKQDQKPVVIAGFEPLDVMQSSLMLIRQCNRGEAIVQNEYTRVVTEQGNVKAQALMNRVFTVRDRFEWRGLGWITDSALKLRSELQSFDAESRFPLTAEPVDDVKGCECPAILRGVKNPQDCKLLGTVCTPENPMGSCMVSSEGACAAYWSYGRQRQKNRQRLAL
jgi:hydrogenase expression/formation protein HypD